MRALNPEIVSRDSDTVTALVGHVPFCFHQWNRAMRGAYLKGARAAVAGLPSGACPYIDRRKECGRLTWSRSFIAAWEQGHREATRHRLANTEGQPRSEAT